MKCSEFRQPNLLKDRKKIKKYFQKTPKFRSAGLHDQVDELVLDVNDLDDLHAGDGLGDLLARLRRFDNSILIAVHGDDDRALELAADLTAQLNGGGDGLAHVILRPRALHRHLALVLGGKSLLLPQLFDHVGCERREHEQQRFKVSAADAGRIELVDHSHEGGDGGGHLQRVNIVRDLLDGLVDDRRVLFGDALLVGHKVGEVPDAIEEALAALDG